MRLPFRWTLALRFFAVFLLLEIAAIAGVGRLLSDRATRLFRAETEADVRALAAAAPAAADTDAARRFVTAAGDSGRRVSWFGSDGSLLADSEYGTLDPPEEALPGGRPEVAEAMAAGVGDRFRRPHGQDRLYYFAAVRLDPPQASRGVLRLGIPPPEVQSRIGSPLGPLVGWGLALAALAFLGISIASGYAVRPVEDLARTAEKLAGGDLEGPVRTMTGGEMERIETALFGLAASLRSREGEARREGDQLRLVVESMVEGVMLLDTGGRVLLDNPSVRRLLGSPGTLIGRTAIEALRNPEFGTAVGGVLAEGGVRMLEVRIQPVPGEGEGVASPPSGRMLRINLASLGDHRAGGVLAVVHDITRRKELETMRRDFVANVSHELRTPLTAITGYVETLLDSEVPAPERRRFLEKVARHSERLSRLIEDLLELSRLESPQTRLETRPLVLDGAVGRAVGLMESGAARRGVHLETTLPAGLPLVVADERALEQILVNLLDNAVKYTPSGGQVTVVATRENDRVRVTVRDTGPGIPPGDIPRLFERFYRVDRARSREEGGTGLGLAIVKHLVGGLGGEVGVESAVGKGSAFWFTLKTG